MSWEIEKALQSYPSNSLASKQTETEGSSVENYYVNRFYYMVRIKGDTTPKSLPDTMRQQVLSKCTGEEMVVIQDKLMNGWNLVASPQNNPVDKNFGFIGTTFGLSIFTAFLTMTGAGQLMALVSMVFAVLCGFGLTRQAIEDMRREKNIQLERKKSHVISEISQINSAPALETSGKLGQVKQLLQEIAGHEVWMNVTKYPLVNRSLDLDATRIQAEEFYALDKNSPKLDQLVKDLNILLARLNQAEEIDRRMVAKQIGEAIDTQSSLVAEAINSLETMVSNAAELYDVEEPEMVLKVFDEPKSLEATKEETLEKVDKIIEATKLSSKGMNYTLVDNDSTLLDSSHVRRVTNDSSGAGYEITGNDLRVIYSDNDRTVVYADGEIIHFTGSVKQFM